MVVNFKNKQGYVEKKLKDILERELAYIEERTEWEKGAKDYFGDKMYETLKEINESREQALLSDSGNIISNFNTSRKVIIYTVDYLSFILFISSVRNQNYL